MAYRLQNGLVVLTRLLSNGDREELLLPPDRIDLILGTPRENEAYLYSSGGPTPRVVLLESGEYRGLFSVLTGRHYRVGERGIVRSDAITWLAADASYGMAGSVRFPVETPFRAALREGYRPRPAASGAVSRPWKRSDSPLVLSRVWIFGCSARSQRRILSNTSRDRKSVV